MSKILDLNSLQIPTLELTFTDDKHTTLHVTAPTEALISELESWVKGGLEPLSKGDQASIGLAYDLTARLLSCNREGITITAEELRATYRVDLWTLIPVVNGYMEFISEIKNEKN